MPFFIDEGLVELLPKNQVKIDEASKELDFDGGRIKYDYLIKGDMETPRLNDIEIIDSSGETYEYCYRENYLGVVPLKLKNVYVAGLTRPTTGGIGNITEIQSLLIHKSITNKSFKRKLFKNINKRIWYRL